MCFVWRLMSRPPELAPSPDLDLYAAYAMLLALAVAPIWLGSWLSVWRRHVPKRQGEPKVRLLLLAPFAPPPPLLPPCSGPDLAHDGLLPSFFLN